MNGMRKSGLSASIREKALSLGFDLCGITRSRELTEYAPVLRKWCGSGMNDRMTYLSRGIEKRINPGILFPGAESIVVTGLNYYTRKLQKAENVPIVSRYALGQDYHDLITHKLDRLMSFIKTVIPEADGRPYVDSAPILEKPWAVQSGLGWQGKHSIVINDKIGSFFFIGILVLNIELEYDEPFHGENCGDCRICIDQCPTGAINNDRTIDARKCISNLTIENRDPVPGEIASLLGGRIYGCDKCQDVCPWNDHAQQHNSPELTISEELASMTREDWLSLSNEQFDKVFKGTPVGRVKFDKFRGNIEAATRTHDHQVS